jgi:hypothetical protein
METFVSHLVHEIERRVLPSCCKVDSLHLLFLEEEFDMRVEA